MTDFESNTDILRHCYGKWDQTKGGSVDDWMAIMAEEIDFRSLAMGRDPSVSFTTPCGCKAEVRGYMDGLLKEWEMIHYTVDDYVEQNGMVCAIGSTAWKHKGTGNRVDTPKMDFYRFEDGKVVAFYEFYDTAALIKGAGG